MQVRSICQLGSSLYAGFSKFESKGYLQQLDTPGPKVVAHEEELSAAEELDGRIVTGGHDSSVNFWSATLQNLQHI